MRSLAPAARAVEAAVKVAAVLVVRRKFRREDCVMGVIRVELVSNPNAICVVEAGLQP